jgi:hypothetical protein
MKTFLLTACTFLCAIAQGLASVTFSDDYADRLVRFTEEGESFYEVISGGKFTARGKMEILAADSSITLDRDTPVSVSIGSWNFDGVLGDDPKFVPGKSKSVNIPLLGGSLKLAISRGMLTWSLTAKTGFSNAGDEFEVSPVAEALYAEESFPITPADDQVVECSFTIATASATANIPLTGSVKYVLKKVGSGDLADEYGLCTVKVKGLATLARD